VERGAVKVSKAKLVAVWLPDPLVQALDTYVLKTDSDRSKIIRAALRAKLNLFQGPEAKEAA